MTDSSTEIHGNERIQYAEGWPTRIRPRQLGIRVHSRSFAVQKPSHKICENLRKFAVQFFWVSINRLRNSPEWAEKYSQTR